MKRRIAKKIQKEFLRWHLVLGEVGAIHGGPMVTMTGVHIDRPEELFPGCKYIPKGQTGYFRPLRYTANQIAKAQARLPTGWRTVHVRIIAERMSGRSASRRGSY